MHRPGAAGRATLGGACSVAATARASGARAFGAPEAARSARSMRSRSCAEKESYLSDCVVAGASRVE